MALGSRATTRGTLNRSNWRGKRSLKTTAILLLLLYYYVSLFVQGWFNNDSIVKYDNRTQYNMYSAHKNKII